MNFRVLGPVEFEIAGAPVDLGPVKQQTVLAAMLVEPGRLVTSQILIERVWDSRPPADGKNSLYTYVARLRRILREASSRSGETVGLLRQPGGYRLQVDPEKVDLYRFRLLLNRNRLAIDASDTERADWLRTASSLWQGTPLAGLPGNWAARTRELLLRQYIELLVQQADVEARLGNSGSMVDTLREALSEHPFSDALLGRLLSSLHRSGRGTEALETFARARERMISLGGGEPSVAVRRVFEAIQLETTGPIPELIRSVQAVRPTVAAPAVDPSEPGPLWPNDDAAVDTSDDQHPEPATEPGPADESSTSFRAAPRSVPGFPPQTIPNLLPGDFVDFCGRPEEVAWLKQTLDGGGRRAPALVVISGKGGIGKSALAMHVAHRLRRSFPGGALFLDLQGTSQSPVSATDALERMLRVLEVSRIPRSLGERAELYRNLLAERQVLVVLDDAASEAQVEPLLPGGDPCAVLITSRTLLAGLHADRLPLQPLSEESSLELLTRALGADRLQADIAAARELVRLCEGLPLALWIAASRLISQPHWTVARLVRKLAPESRRLDELSHGGRSVRASLDLSFRILDAASRAVMQRLALSDQRRYRPAAVARLLGGDPALVEDILDRLVEVHALEVEPDGQDRIYRMPPLERLLARERASGPERRLEPGRMTGPHRTGTTDS